MKPAPTITLKTLEKILYNETSVIAPEDVPRLMLIAAVASDREANKQEVGLSIARHELTERYSQEVAEADDD